MVVVSEGVVLVIDKCREIKIVAISKCDGGVLFVVGRTPVLVLDAVRPQDGKEHGPPRSAGVHSQWQPLRTSLPCMNFTNAPSLLGGEWLCEPT